MTILVLSFTIIMIANVASFIYIFTKLTFIIQEMAKLIKSENLTDYNNRNGKIIEEHKEEDRYVDINSMTDEEIKQIKINIT